MKRLTVFNLSENLLRNKDDKNKKYSVDIYISPHIDKNSKERIVPANKVVYWLMIWVVMPTEKRRKSEKEWADKLKEMEVVWYCYYLEEKGGSYSAATTSMLK